MQIPKPNFIKIYRCHPIVASLLTCFSPLVGLGQNFWVKVHFCCCWVGAILLLRAARVSRFGWVGAGFGLVEEGCLGLFRLASGRRWCGDACASYQPKVLELLEIATDLGFIDPDRASRQSGGGVWRGCCILRVTFGTLPEKPVRG